MSSVTLSVDLRARVVDAVAAGASQLAAATRFGVSPASASRWCAQMRQTGALTPKPRGGDQRSHRVEEHAKTILSLYEAHPTSFLSDLRMRLSEQGIKVSQSSLSRFFKRHTITRKKSRRTPPSRTGRT